MCNSRPKILSGRRFGSSVPVLSCISESAPFQLGCFWPFILKGHHAFPSTFSRYKCLANWKCFCYRHLALRAVPR
jgi:hypothetical protein